MSINVSSSSSSGIGFFGLVTVVLMTLKLLGYINISWGMVVLPFFIPLILLLIFAVFAVIFALLVK